MPSTNFVRTNAIRYKNDLTALTTVFIWPGFLSCYPRFILALLHASARRQLAVGLRELGVQSKGSRRPLIASCFSSRNDPDQVLPPLCSMLKRASLKRPREYPCHDNVGCFTESTSMMIINKDARIQCSREGIENEYMDTGSYTVVARSILHGLGNWCVSRCLYVRILTFFVSE